MKAVLEYPKEEESEEVDLTDLMKDGHIALSKSMHVMKIFTCNLAGHEPELLLGHLQPQPHLMSATSMLTNSLSRILLYHLLLYHILLYHLLLYQSTHQSCCHSTVFAMQFGPSSFSGWSHEQMHIAMF